MPPPKQSSVQMKPIKRFIKIGPRYVKQDEDGLRPFQCQGLEAVLVEINHA